MSAKSYQYVGDRSWSPLEAGIRFILTLILWIPTIVVWLAFAVLFRVIIEIGDSQEMRWRFLGITARRAKGSDITL